MRWVIRSGANSSVSDDATPSTHGAVQADRVAQAQPVGEPAGALVWPVVVLDALAPPPAYLRQRAVGDDGGVLLRQRLLVVPAVGHETADLVGTQLAREHRLLERVLLPVQGAAAAQVIDKGHCSLISMPS